MKSGGKKSPPRKTAVAKKSAKKRVRAKTAGKSKASAAARAPLPVLPAAPTFWYSDVKLTLKDLAKQAAKNPGTMKPMSTAKAVAAAKHIGLLTPSGKLSTRYKRRIVSVK